ncbi:thioredoxin-like protein [Pilobolus umbonatus]|nr:thioredoxin-like protein [Pilobolus umbonatus]
MSRIEEIVEETIKTNRVVVYSKTYCPYCTKAKKVLQDMGIEFIAIELDQEDDGAAIQQYLLKKTGQRTVPNIFINQQHIGGCDDLLATQKSGKLQTILSK